MFTVYMCRSCSLFFFFTDPATTELYTLSLHDALPIFTVGGQLFGLFVVAWTKRYTVTHEQRRLVVALAQRAGLAIQNRSEEHTSELQSHVNLVCRLLLEKKKKKTRKLTSYKLQSRAMS